jgi:type II secretory pathway pseudopilin PulG
MAILGVLFALVVPAVGASARSTPAWQTQAVAQLAQLQVKPAATMTGYSRDRFGTPWSDVDDNGCDTRNDILQRDLSPFTLKSGNDCVVANGTLHDPYTGRVIKFVRGIATSAAIQIDHVVALADAWRTGAKKWRKHRRLVYANDPKVLLAVDGPANQQKSDGDASQWLPQKFTCRYVADQIEVKKKYSLWVTQSEHDAMAAVLASC